MNANEEPVGPRLRMISIVVAASTTLLFELVQTRILSFIFWNHIVYLTISLALLGFGISGTLVAMGRTAGTPSRALMSRLWLGFGLSILGALVVTQSVLPALHSWEALPKLALLYVLFTLPFVFAGALISHLLASAGAAVGRLYAADLVASGVACGLFFWALPAFGAPVLGLVLCLATFVMGVCTAPDGRGRGLNVGLLVTVSALTGLVAVFPRQTDFTPEGYKPEFSLARRNPAMVIEQTRWTPLTRIDVIGTSDGTSPLSWYPEHPQGSFKLITQDATAHTRLVGKAALDQLARDIAQGTERQPPNLVYEIRKEPSVAVIGVGGGVDVANALLRGARHVTGLELNPAIAEYVSSRYAEFNGHLFSDPRLRFLNMEGRAFMRSSSERYDLIQVIGVDTFAALNSGAYVLSENYLYTQEAFEDYYEHLEDGGIVSFYRWAFPVPREELRVCMLAAAAWRKRSESAARSTFVASNGAWALTLFRKGAFSVQETEQLAARVKQLGLHVLYWPKVLADQATRERAYFEQAPAGIREQHAAFDGAITAFDERREEAFFAAYPFQIRPTTDDSPFFFEYNRLGPLGLPSLRDLRGNGASTTLLILLVETTVVAVLAIALPLWRFKRRGLSMPGAGYFSAYFAALGFGFMLVEIALMQKGVLFLGSPLHSISAVLAALLIAAGSGSLVQSRLSASAGDRLLIVVGVVLPLLVGAYALGLGHLFRALLHLSFAARLVVLFLVIAPAGFLMGMLFPAGLSRVGEKRAEFVPWAWGINGATSVYASILAIVIALTHGFGVALWLGAACYVIAAVTFVLGSRKLAHA